VHRPIRRGRVAAITFDFWNTLYAADGGTMDKVRPRRIEALRRLLVSNGVRPTEEELREAYRAGFDAYLAAWSKGAHFGAREQVLFILAHFAVETNALHDDLIAWTVGEIEDASLLAPLQLLPGVRETLPALAARYRLGIISDTSLTPGRLLRKFLEKDGLLDHFSALTFSDETGYPKPDRRMFENTLAALGARPADAVHVGDTPRTDIAGAQAVGMIAIRCAGAADHQEPPQADFMIRDHREIPPILDGLRRPDFS
jgi:HAD superfamily hydrolase (TIGR01549 family)